jgi:hypothetical protein
MPTIKAATLQSQSDQNQGSTSISLQPRENLGMTEAYYLLNCMCAGGPAGGEVKYRNHCMVQGLRLHAAALLLCLPLLSIQTLSFAYPPAALAAQMHRLTAGTCSWRSASVTCLDAHVGDNFRYTTSARIIIIQAGNCYHRVRQANGDPRQKQSLFHGHRGSQRTSRK